MEENKKRKIEWWRITLFVISVLVIVTLWARKDIASVINMANGQDVGPLILTTVLVTLTKAALVAGLLILIKYLVVKFRNNRK